MAAKKTASKAGTRQKATPKKLPAKKKAAAKKRGRPTGYCPEVSRKICLQVVEGASLRKICRSSAMPSISTVCKWLSEIDEFSEQYTRAVRTRALVRADDIVDIAKSKLEPAEKRVIIDALKWEAARMQPKVYGDKVEVKSEGEHCVFVRLDDIRQKRESE